MNIVFLSQRVPHPPDRGDRISTFHILRHFREIGARVVVGCLAEDDRDMDAIRELDGLVDEVCAPRISPKIRKILSLRGLLTGSPLTLPYFAESTLQKTVDRWMRERQPDLVFLYSSSMAQYVLGHEGAKRVMHFAELDSDKWRQYAAKSGAAGRFIYGREYRKLLEFERKVARSFDASLVVSEVEKDLFMECIPDVTPVVLPNGVDVDHFSSSNSGSRDGSNHETRGGSPHTVIFTGVMDYEPNVDGVCWFAEECWPAIRQRHADAEFLIVGNRPVPKVSKLAEQPGITVTGWVEETPPWFDKAGIAIAPLRLARGLQNKVLEAMSMGLPVVCTPSAAQGLGSVSADTLPVETDANAITQRVLALMDNPDEARAIGARGAQFVREHFRWDAVFEKLDTTLRGLGIDVPSAPSPEAP